MPVQTLQIDSIVRHPSCQPRAAIDRRTVDEYTEAMQGGETFPPVTVFFDGDRYLLGDGWHRILAALNAGKKKIEAEVIKGSLADAKWYSYSANSTHGLRRTNEDKARAVQAALKHPRSAKLSDNQIAKHCGVDHVTVGRWREKLIASCEVHKIETRTVTRNGTSYQQDVTRIGRRNADREEITAPPNTGLTFGTVFSGIGGWDLGLTRAGMTCKFQIEIDPYCRKVLARHFPGAKRYV